MGNVTIKDIAVLAGVSPSTVSRAINSRNGVGEETRQRIVDICLETGYMPNALARGLVNKKTSTIGLIVPDVRSPFYSEIIAYVEEAARDLNYSIMWCNNFRNYEREEEYFKLFIENRVEGIIICPVGTKTLPRLEKYFRLVPTVVLGDKFLSKDFSQIYTDNYIGGSIAANYLIDLGHKDLMFVGLKGDRFAYAQRLEGFKQTAEKRGIHVRCLPAGEIESTGLERGYDLFKDFLNSGGELPDAVFASTDHTALGIIQICEEKGIMIPEAFSIIGFDNIAYSSLPRIMLTTVAQGKRELTTGALQMLLKIINNPSDCKACKKVVTPILVERNTCLNINPHN